MTACDYLTLAAVAAMVPVAWWIGHAFATLVWG